MTKGAPEEPGSLKVGYSMIGVSPLFSSLALLGPDRLPSPALLATQARFAPPTSPIFPPWYLFVAFAVARHTLHVAKCPFHYSKTIDFAKPAF